MAGHPRRGLLLWLAQAGDPRPHLGRDRQGRRRHPALARALEDPGGTDSPDLTTHRRGPGAAAGTPRPRQPARLPPRRHPRPPLAHGVAHRLPGGRGADPLPPRLSPHRRPQPDPRQRPRAGCHAPDRTQEPRHLRPLQHHQRAGTARRRGPACRLSGAAGAGGASPPAVPRGRSRRPAFSPHHPSASYDAPPHKGARATGAKRPAIVAHAAPGRPAESRPSR